MQAIEVVVIHESRSEFLDLPGLIQYLFSCTIVCLLNPEPKLVTGSAVQGGSSQIRQGGRNLQQTLMGLTARVGEVRLYVASYSDRLGKRRREV
jgi:hypothetical protein